MRKVSGEDRVRELISAQRIQHRVEELAQQINDDFSGVELLYLIIILRGGCFFGVDLAKRLTMPVRLDYIRVTTYSGTKSSGVVSMVSDIMTDVRGKPVLVLDDIIDTGFTMEWILRYLELKNPGVVRVATLLDKPARREYDLHIDYIGFTVPNVFVAGYGLDGLDDTMANLPGVIAVEPTDEEVSIPPRSARLPAL
ncbi:MAG TPA: hypoxanthine phosphoribosyltransferase [Chloroflexi bacterium]|nr:hypoxanthine phosphoribosyltransferase [Chloroflexota bacterium]